MANATIEYDGKMIAKALAEFQADLPAVTLDGKNPHFNSEFVTLANLSTVVLPKLAKHGMAFTATPKVTENGFVMEAHLLHESGERLSASFPITETNPQKVGSAVTYYRRYALAALTGVVADKDDDGNAASAGPTQAERKIEAARKVATTKTAAKSSGNDARDKIRVEYIESGKVDKDTVNKMIQSAKAEGKGDAFETVLKKLEKGEVG